VRRSRGETGSGTLVVTAMASLLLLIGAALAVVTAMVVDHRAAQSAADLAALAAARGLAEGGNGCAIASRTAAANGARITGCAVSGRIVDVEVVVRGPHWLGQGSDLAARSRAGPAQ
jgi:secretion/DNA translocation related TadE-like protein